MVNRVFTRNQYFAMIVGFQHFVIFFIKNEILWNLDLYIITENLEFLCIGRVLVECCTSILPWLTWMSCLYCCVQAAEGDRLDAARMLLEADSSVIHQTDNSGRTPVDCVPTDCCCTLRSLLS